MSTNELTKCADEGHDGLMYGKHFASMYTGSMYGKSALVFAVWGYVISHFRASKKDGQCYVELHPAMLAGIFSTSPEAVLEALSVLEAPDDASRTKVHEGRRLILLTEQRVVGPLHYLVVNGKAYKAIRDEEDRREYLKEAQRLSRARRMVNKGIDCQPPSTHAEGDGDPEGRSISVPSEPRSRGVGGKREPVDYSTVPGFLLAWGEYPHYGARRDKRAAAAVWVERELEAAATTVRAWVAVLRDTDGARDGGKYVPAMEVWLKKVDPTEAPPSKRPPPGPSKYGVTPQVVDCTPEAP